MPSLLLQPKGLASRMQPERRADQVPEMGMCVMTTMAVLFFVLAGVLSGYSTAWSP